LPYLLFENEKISEVDLCAVPGFMRPKEEADYVKDMKMSIGGSDPIHLIRAIKKYGLKYKEVRP
jgi:pyruvate-formate lyase-activating enzyme